MSWDRFDSARGLDALRVVVAQ
ncbi:MAG: hypothetical protein JWN22_749, partial [Nocardioides sp.]|nr:hypothetical protein [Nocardioides sp.]